MYVYWKKKQVVWRRIIAANPYIKTYPTNSALIYMTWYRFIKNDNIYIIYSYDIYIAKPPWLAQSKMLCHLPKQFYVIGIFQHVHQTSQKTAAIISTGKNIEFCFRESSTWWIPEKGVFKENRPELGCWTTHLKKKTNTPQSPQLGFKSSRKKHRRERNQTEIQLKSANVGTVSTF